MTQEIKAGSILIAKYLGWKQRGDNESEFWFPNSFPIYNVGDAENTGETTDNIENALFHSDWNWLMYVVNKINKRDCICIYFNDECIIHAKKTGEFDTIYVVNENKPLIITVFEAVVKYIETINNLNK